MAKGKNHGGGETGGTGGDGDVGQSKKLCQVFLRNLPLAMLEPVSGVGPLEAGMWKRKDESYGASVFCSPCCKAHYGKGVY